MFFKAYQLKSLINPSLKIWGIYCFLVLAIPSYAQESPQQRLAQFLKKRIPDEMECFQQADYNIRKLDNNCLQNYLEAIQNSQLFSSAYIEDKKAQHKEIRALVAKFDTLSYLGGMLTSTPYTSEELIYALENSSSTKIDKNKAIVTINIKKPYKHKLLYNFDLEENIWKISSVEEKN